MQEVQELLKQKELQLEALTQEIDALRLTLKLLEQAESSKAQGATRAALRKRTLSLAAGAERSERVNPIQTVEDAQGTTGEAALEFP
jgi:hypothetical protein